MVVPFIMMIADNPVVMVVGNGCMGNQDRGSNAQDQYGQPAVQGSKYTEKTDVNRQALNPMKGI